MISSALPTSFILSLLFWILQAGASDISDPLFIERELQESEMMLDNATVISCVYGRTDPSFGKFVGLGTALAILIALIVIGSVLVGGVLLFPLFRGAGALIGYAASFVAVHKLIISWPTWIDYGPGEDYVPGVSANNLQVALSAFGFFLFYMYLLIFGVALLVNEDEARKRVQVFVGFLIAHGAFAYSVYFAFTQGVPSVFIGETEALNDDACSGPQAWSQLSGLVRFTEIAFFLGPTVSQIPILGQIFDLVVLVISGLVIRQENNAYHRSIAIFDLVTSCFQFVTSCCQMASSNDSNSRTGMTDYMLSSLTSKK